MMHILSLVSLFALIFTMMLGISRYRQVDSRYREFHATRPYVVLASLMSTVLLVLLLLSFPFRHAFSTRMHSPIVTVSIAMTAVSFGLIYFAMKPYLRSKSLGLGSGGGEALQRVASNPVALLCAISYAGLVIVSGISIPSPEGVPQKTNSEYILFNHGSVHQISEAQYDEFRIGDLRNWLAGGALTAGACLILGAGAVPRGGRDTPLAPL